MAKAKPPSVKTVNGVKAAWILATVLGGLLLIFVLARWARPLLRKTPSSLGRFSQRIRKILVRRVSGFSSTGHALLVVIYVVANVVLSFTNVNLSGMEHIGARFGWMCLANFAFIVFLALKNTPLAVLTDYSYERLNGLHRIAGYTTVVHMLLHMITFCADWSENEKLHKLLEVKNVMGIVAGISMFIIFLSALFIMRSRYEIFYMLHILMFLLAAITTAMHRPKWRNEVPKVVCVLGSLWLLDRYIRTFRMLYNSVNNHATIEALSNDMTRVVLKKKLPGVVAGRHCFLWIPKIKLLQTHPFTIVSNTSAGLELVAKSHDGFTKSLHEFARTATPGTTIFASVDGPYGTIPDLQDFDRVFLFAGGSGGTFVFGMVQNMLQKERSAPQPSVDIFWATRKHENITWFAEHIDVLSRDDSRITSTIYLTKHKRESESGSSSETATVVQETQYPHSADDLVISEKSVIGNLTQNTDVTSPEKIADGAVTPSDSSIRSYKLNYGKLRLEDVISQCLDSAATSDRVLFATCGPAGMGRETREIVTRLMPVEGPNVTLHIEHFGW